MSISLAAVRRICCKHGAAVMRGCRGLGRSWLLWPSVQIILGALVAGIDAGRAFPDWPLMAGGFLPPEPFVAVPCVAELF